MYYLRITFQSFKKINHLKQKLITLKKNTKLKNIQIPGIFKTKLKKKIFTLLKSPHVNKKAREQFLYTKYLSKVEIKFKTIFQLFNFLILVKKYLSENLLLNIKIIKKK